MLCCFTFSPSYFNVMVINPIIIIFYGQFTQCTIVWEKVQFSCKSTPGLIVKN